MDSGAVASVGNAPDLWLAVAALVVALAGAAGGAPLVRVLWVRVARLTALAQRATEALELARDVAARLAEAGQALGDAQGRLDALDGRLEGVLDADAVRTLVATSRNQDETNIALGAVHQQVAGLGQTVTEVSTALRQVQAALSGQERRVRLLAGEDQAHFHTYERRSQSQTEGRVRYVLVCTECAHRVVFLGPLPAALEQMLAPEPAATPPSMRPMTRPVPVDEVPPGWSRWNPTQTNATQGPAGDTDNAGR